MVLVIRVMSESKSACEPPFSPPGPNAPLGDELDPFCPLPPTIGIPGFCIWAYKLGLIAVFTLEPCSLAATDTGPGMPNTARGACPTHSRKSLRAARR